MVLEGQTAPYDFYPVTLTQYSTRAVPWNQAATWMTKLEPVPDGVGGVSDFREVEIYRFYLDLPRCTSPYWRNARTRGENGGFFCWSGIKSIGDHGPPNSRRQFTNPNTKAMVDGLNQARVLNW